MATPNSNFDQISALVNDWFAPTLPDLVFDKHPLLKMLHAKGSKPQGGTNIRQTLMYQFTKDGAYKDYGLLNVNAEDQFDAAVFPWKHYYQHVTISIPEINKSSGPEAVFKLLDQKMKGAAKAIRDSLATDMYVATYGDSQDQINGLPNLLGNGTWPAGALTTAGAIDKATWSFWQGKQETETGTLGSLDTVQDLWFGIAEGTDVPNLIVSDYAAMKAFQSGVTVQNSQERFTNTNQLLSGFTTITYNGTPWVADRHCTATELYMLQTEYLDLVSHKKENFRWGGFMKPTNQNVQVGHIFWMGNLTAVDPSMSGLIHKT